ncbi:O-antigen ligase like membrane protein [Lachnospiraceae bacterium C7]|nr:O-antigen ligase like membrane protein [Lachnospiraceae bacterium C7]
MGKIIEWLFYLLLFSFVLPSGNVLGIPVKILLVLALFGCIGLEMIRQDKIKIDRYVINIMTIILIMMMWAILSLANGYTPGLKTFIKSSFSLLSVVVIALLCITNGWVDIKKAIKVLWAAVIFYVGLKILIELALIAHVISYDAVGNIFENYLRAEWMSLEFPLGPITCYRITTSNDTIPLILMSVELACGKKSIKNRIFLIGTMAVYSMIVYSRIVIVQFAAMAVIGMFFYFKKQGLTYANMLILAAIVIFVFGFAGLLIFYQDGKYLNNIIGTFAYRFSGTQVEASDGTRVEQFTHLYDGFVSAPFIGHGLGSFVSDYIRSESNPHSYELEYLSYLYQLGVVGTFLIIGGLMYNFFEVSVLWCKERIPQIILFLNFVIWAIKPFFNPGFMSSCSGMTIISFMIIGLYYNEKAKEKTAEEV